ncbi:Ig-like domain-containing protein [Fulvivirgaceae bacterium BMA10]|uniref:Ig-like domain-containing protein n=1 Tax=Splendidivirga corallicola TaxID=3051826 RepID=A0ABT8KQU0_9BACT|nr:Ig-like domain-containing protein [Fulvivirgaceae bacterium BMA10]
MSKPVGISIFCFVMFISMISEGQIKIMPLGNSITEGSHTGISRPVGQRIGYRQSLYIALDGAGYNIDFVGGQMEGQDALPDFDPDHEGHPGFEASQIEANVYSYLGANIPHIVLLHIGTNGLNTSGDATTISQDLDDILDEIDRFETDNGIEIMVFVAQIINRMTNHTPTSEYNALIETIVQNRITAGDKLELVDMENDAGINYSTEMDDNLHPSDAGYGKMGSLWFTHLDAFLSAPSFTSSPVTSATVGEAYSYDVDADGSFTISYAFNNTPPTGMTIDSSSGLINWTPVDGQQGSHDIEVVATNLVGSTNHNFSINVGTDNAPPVFTKGPDVEINEDAGAQSITAWATNIDDGDPELTQNLTFNIINNNPDIFEQGPTINTSGDLSFLIKPDSFGTAVITVTLSDDGDNTPPNNNTSPQQIFTINVLSVNDVPSISDITDQVVEVSGQLDGIAFTINDKETDPNALIVTFESNNQTLLPTSNITVSGTDSNRQLNLVPAAGMTGQVMVTVTVSDGSDASEDMFTLDVENPNAIQDPSISKSIAVYPMPFNDYLNVRIENDIMGEVELNLFDLSGKLLEKRHTTKNNFSFEFSMQPAYKYQGIYLLKINLGDYLVTKKILKY